MPSWKTSVWPRFLQRRRSESLACHQPRSLRIESLEERVLFSATAIDPHVGMASLQTAAVSALMIPPMAEASDGGDIGDKGLGNPEVNLPPVYLGMPPIILSEDANERAFNLAPYFADPEGTPGLQFRLMTADNLQLFDRFQISGSQLIVNSRADMHGKSLATIRVTDALGLSTDFVIPVHILPVNDRPTTIGIGDFVIDDGTTIVIDLFAMFDDKETPDSQLVYSITENTNPDIFRSIDLDPQKGKLTLVLKPELEGMSQLTLRATDADGAYVEMGSRGQDFKVYDYIEGNAVDPQALGLSALNLVTHFALFEYGSGGYDFSEFSESRLAWYVQSEFYDPNLPTIFDIENDYYTNTPEGRERFAEVLRYFRQLQPDANQVGVYSYIPERNYWAPVHWTRVQRDLERGIQTGYTNAAETLEEEYDAWIARNANYRARTLSDGTAVSDWISWTSPSLYTFYGSDYIPTNTGLNFSFETNAATNRLHIADTVLVDGQKIVFELGSVRIPLELLYYTEYYVVNSNGNSFQLSTSEGGAPIDFGTALPSVQYLRLIGQNNHIEHDPDFVDWRDYAAENMAESRKYDNPVVPWLSPSYAGLGANFMDKNYFRMQLDTMFEMADGVALWVPIGDIAALPQNRGWVEALTEFTSYLHNSTQFQIHVTDTPPKLDGLGSGYWRRTDIFDGSDNRAFAAAPYRYDSTGVESFREGDDEDGGMHGLGTSFDSSSSSSHHGEDVPHANVPRAPSSSQFRSGDILAIGQRDLLRTEPWRSSVPVPRSPLSSRMQFVADDLNEKEKTEGLFSLPGVDKRS